MVTDTKAWDGSVSLTIDHLWDDGTDTPIGVNTDLEAYAFVGADSLIRWTPLDDISTEDFETELTTDGFRRIW